MIESFFTNSLTVYIFVAILVSYVISKSIAIAGENQRFAVFHAGRFAGYKGPGLIVKSALSKLVRLSVGDVGTLTGPGFANFGGADVPVKNTGSLKVGDPVRIDRFDDEGPRLVQSSITPKSHCPNCGHEF